MATTAELGRAVAGGGVSGVVPTADEETGRLNVSRTRRVEVQHVVLIVAGGAGDP